MTRTKTFKSLHFLFILMILIILFFSATLSTTKPTYAKPITNKPQTSQEVKEVGVKLLYYLSMRQCFAATHIKSNGLGKTSVEDVDGGTFFSVPPLAEAPPNLFYLKNKAGSKVVTSTTTAGKPGALANSIRCDSTLVEEFIEEFNIGSSRNLFCLGGGRAYFDRWYTREEELEPEQCTDTGANIAHFKTPEDSTKLNFDNIHKLIIEKYYNGYPDPKDFFYSKIHKDLVVKDYLLHSAVGICNLNKASDQNSVENRSIGRYVINEIIIDENNKYSTPNTFYNGPAEKDLGTGGGYVYDNDFYRFEYQNCPKIMDRISDINKSIIEGLDNVLDPGSIDTDNTIEDVVEEVEESGGMISTCNIEGGLGWLLCPVINTMAKIADAAYSYVERDFLIIEKDLLGETTKGVWKQIVNIANIAFVIIFLIVIFSQLTNLGISNYGVKTLLPKLIIAIILVNLSFFICQLAVDLSNLVGSQINSFFTDISTGINKEIIKGGGLPVLGRSGNGMGGLAASVLILGGAVIFMSLSTLITMLIGVIIAIVMIMFILVARKALVIILTVIAPLAFIAYILPNTKKMFDTWKKAFISILMVYPITALVFFGSRLASYVILNVAAGAGEPEERGKIMEIIGSAVAVLPLFVVPGVLKKSLDGIAGLGNIISKMDKSAAGLGKSGVGKIQKKYSDSDYGKYRTARKADIKARTKAGNYNGKNPIRRGLSKAYVSANNNRALNALGGGFGANKEKIMNKQDKEDAKEFTEMAGDNEDVITAIANNGFDENSDAFRGLSQENQNTVRKMKALGLDRKASTYLATAGYMSENGMGTGEDVDRLLQKARDNGARENTVHNAYNAALSGIKKSGRADSLFYLNNQAAARGVSGVNSMATMAEAFAKINPTDISKYALKTDDGFERGLEGGATEADLNARGLFSDEQKKTQFRNMLQDPSNRTILASYVNHANDIKNPDAQRLASAEIIKATGNVISSNEAMFGDIQETQNYIKAHGFNNAPPPA